MACVRCCLREKKTPTDVDLQERKLLLQESSAERGEAVCRFWADQPVSAALGRRGCHWKTQGPAVPPEPVGSRTAEGTAMGNL